MADIVDRLTLDDVVRAVNDIENLGAPINGVSKATHLSGFEEGDVPCLIVSLKVGNAFDVYIQEQQSLCFQAVVQRPAAGFTDVATWWNLNRRFAKALPCLDGYFLRFEADICFGVTKENLKFMIREFTGALVEFSTLASNPRQFTT